MTKITNRQIFFLIVITLTSYSVIDISRAMAASAGTGSWFTILIAMVIFCLLAVMVVYLNNMFKGKMLFDYTKELYSKPLAYFFSLYYVIYFLMIAVFLALNMAKVLKMDFFPKTPIWAMIALSVPLFSYIAYKGLQTAARMCEFFGLIFILTGVTVQTIMLTQGKPENIRPFFVPSETKQYLLAIKEAIFPFLGIEILLVVPMGKHNGKKSIRTVFFAVVFIGLLYILIVESCIMKLGLNDIVNYNDSLVEAIRDLSLPFLDFFERFDILFLTVGFVALYIGISIVFTAITEYVCKMIPKVKRLLVVIILGALVIILAVIAGLINDFNIIVKELGIYMGLFAVAVIPIFLLVSAKVKRHGT